MDKLVKNLAKYDFVVVNYATKVELLKLRLTNPRIRAKIITSNDIIEEFLGKESDRTLKYISEKFNFDFEYSSILNENLIFKKEVFFNNKTTLLSNLRLSLLSEALLPTTRLAMATFKGKRLLLAPEFSDHSLLLDLLYEAGSIIDFMSLPFTYTHTVKQYPTGIEEIFATLNDIAILLDNGVSAADIKIVRPQSEYLTLLHALGHDFNITFNDPRYTLFDYPEVQNFLRNYRDNEVVLHEVLNSFLADDTNVMIALKNLYSTLNEQDIPKGEFLKYFIYKLKHHPYQNSVNNGIEIINELPYIANENSHYFYLNFAEGNTPAQGGNNPFLTNTEKDAFGLLNDEKTAKCREIALISALQNIRNMHLSFANVFLDAEYKPSSLVQKLSFTQSEAEISKILYSSNYLEYLTNIRRDELQSFNKVDPLLGMLLRSNAKRDNYLSFDYQFSGINYKHQKIALSYSSIELYYNLPFDYFAKYLLGLSNDERIEHMEYGNFVHSVFEHSKDLESFKFVFAQLLDTGDFSAKEKFYINNTKDLIYLSFAKFYEYQKITRPNAIYKEDLFSINYSDNYTLNGRIDRLLTFKKDGRTYGLVIDFKTGGIVFEPKKYSQGLNLQLPIYGLLVSRQKKYETITPIALVINSLKPEKHTLSSNELLKESSAKSLKFKGLVVGNIELLPLLDPGYTASEFYRGLRMSKSNVLYGTIEQELFDEYLQVANDKIEETFTLIANNEFPVRTLILNNKRTGEYSDYREISYIPFYVSDELDGADDEREAI